MKDCASFQEENAKRLQRQREKDEKKARKEEEKERKKSQSRTRSTTERNSNPNRFQTKIIFLDDSEEFVDIGVSQTITNPFIPMEFL